MPRKSIRIQTATIAGTLREAGTNSGTPFSTTTTQSGSFTVTESGNYVDGSFSFTQTGNDRYKRLEQWDNTSNAFSGGNGPGQ